MAPTATSPPPTTHHLALATQVQHNLRHQHDWTNLHIHPPSLSAPGPSPHPPISSSQPPPPRPLLSGRPPQRIYTHPDDDSSDEKKGEGEGDGDKGGEWVLPTHIRERWTLRGLAAVFDWLPSPPPLSSSSSSGTLFVSNAGEGEKREGREGAENEEAAREGAGEEDWVKGMGKGGARRKGKWKREKRVLLAVVGDDSTVVYYVVLEGVVKPRQN